ncbi:FlaG protein [mine drainage metagenome]|uniref:FlaG protein n=1 Tax=mine drainage metagenome TaxID=410659 RepID=A0A1J5SVJ9_9ZZZZ
MQGTPSEPSPVANKATSGVGEVSSNVSANTKTSPEQVDKALKQVNDAFTQKNLNLLASVEKDKETGINVLKVTDKDTKEVIRQFPEQAVIVMAQAIDQSLDPKGHLIHVKA